MYNLLTLSVLDEGYSRNMLCGLNMILMVNIFIVVSKIYKITLVFLCLVICYLLNFDIK